MRCIATSSITLSPYKQKAHTRGVLLPPTVAKSLMLWFELLQLHPECAFKFAAKAGRCTWTEWENGVRSEQGTMCAAWPSEASCVILGTANPGTAAVSGKLRSELLKAGFLVVESKWESKDPHLDGNSS